MGALVSRPAAFVYVTHILVSDNSITARMNHNHVHTNEDTFENTLFSLSSGLCSTLSRSFLLWKPSKMLFRIDRSVNTGLTL